MPMRTHSGQRLHRFTLELPLQLETRPQRVARVVEPEQQPVTELLHDATRRRERGADEHFLALEQRDRVLVTVGIGQLGETDDVGEDDRARRGRHLHSIESFR